MSQTHQHHGSEAKLRQPYTPGLSELQAFTACAATGSTTRAAEQLGLTQSAVSRALGTLEARLGVRLFHRVRQRLVISDAGRAMLADAERILAELDAAALTVMSFGGHSEVLRIAALPTFGAAWLVPRLMRFAEVAPEVTFDLRATLAPVDFERDAAGRATDVAILRGEPAARSAVLLPEVLLAVAAPRLLPGGAPLPEAALARLPLLQQATRPELWRDWFRDAGLDPITILRGARFEQFAMVLAAARAGMGVALVPEPLVAEDLALGRLCLASSRRMTGPHPYVMRWPERSETRASFRRFRDWLLAGN